MATTKTVLSDVDILNGIRDAYLEDFHSRIKHPLSYKIRDSELRIKGGRRISCSDLTKFMVLDKARKSSRSKDIIVKPIWNWDNEEPGNIVDLTPMLAYGLPLVLKITNWAMAEYVNDDNNGFTLHEESDKRVLSEADPKIINKYGQVISSMLINSSKLASEDVLGCAMKILIESMCGPDNLAKCLMRLVNTNDQLCGAFVYIETLVNPNSLNSKVLFEPYTYTHKSNPRIKLHITHTELACVSLTLLWVASLVQVFSADEVLTNLKYDRIFYSLQQSFSYALGNDALGMYIRRGIILDDTYRQNKQDLTRTQLDDWYLFNHVYDTQLDPGYTHTMRVYPALTVGSLVELVGVTKDHCDYVLEAEEKLEEKDARIARLENELANSRKQNDMSHLEKQAAVDKLVDLKDDSQKEIDRLRARLRQTQEELESIRANLASYYSDEAILDENDNAVAEVPISECVENIKDYSILVTGGFPTFKDKLVSYGLTNITQNSDATRVPVGSKYDFYCLYTRYCGHKQVFYLKSHFDTEQRFFYFNGTSPEAFIRAANDFITKYFEV